MPIYPIRRRPRECKTCLACRASKVRCDRNVPCSNCVKRNFDCSYGRPPSISLSGPDSLTTTPTTLHYSPLISPRPRSNPPPPRDGAYGTAHPSTNDAADLPEMIDISQAEWDEINTKLMALEQILGSLGTLFQAHPSCRRVDERPPERRRPEGVYGSNVLRTGRVHFGSQSALVDILNQSRGSEAAHALLEEDLLADLALGNDSAAYPFVDLWSSDPFTFNIAGVCAKLPDDEQCHRFLKYYTDIGAVLYPVLPDLDALERKANRLLEGRRRAGGVYKPDANGLVKPFGMDLPFLSLFFAVLASGCQLSDISESDRESTSGAYVSCAYQCLRMLNYVSQCSVEVIQILLIIGNVLSYNMNAGASYTLLGMTERMCISLGLHVEETGVPLAEKATRRRAWWAMAFQNSHFSLAYDRPSITMVSQPEIPFDAKSMPGHRTYFETLCRIVSLSLELLRSRISPESSHPRFLVIWEYKQRIQRVLAEATPHLRYREQCRSLAEHIERTELRLHSSYLRSVLCRVSLDPRAHLDEQRRALIREDLINSLVNTIDAFVELHEINSHCSRSWISLQRSIASALLLVINDESTRTWGLIDRLEKVLADHVYADGAADQNNRTDSAKNLASSLRALREFRQDFCARKISTAAPSPVSIPQPVIPAHPSMGSYPQAPPSMVTAGPVTSMEDSSMRNILGRVSDVMLFPSMR